MASFQQNFGGATKDGFARKDSKDEKQQESQDIAEVETGGTEINEDYHSASDEDVKKRGPGRPKKCCIGNPGRPRKQYSSLNLLRAKAVSIPATIKAAALSSMST